MDPVDYRLQPVGVRYDEDADDQHPEEDLTHSVVEYSAVLPFWPAVCRLS